MKYQTFQNLPVAWSNQMRAGAEDNRASQGIGKPENGMKLTVGKRKIIVILILRLEHWKTLESRL